MDQRVCFKFGEKAPKCQKRNWCPLASAPFLYIWIQNTSSFSYFKLNSKSKASDKYKVAIFQCIKLRIGPTEQKALLGNRATGVHGCLLSFILVWFVSQLKHETFLTHRSNQNENTVLKTLCTATFWMWRTTFAPVRGVQGRFFPRRARGKRV